MIEKEVNKSILDELNKIDAKIKNCRNDIKNSDSNRDKENVELLEQLKRQHDKLIHDLETYKSIDSGLWENLKITAEAFARETSEKLDSLFTSREIIKQDIRTASDIIDSSTECLIHYEIDVEVKNLRSTDGKVIADRDVKVKNKVTGIEKVYRAGLTDASVWLAEFNTDIKSGYFK